MMDTILNLGLNDETVEALAKSSGNERFAWDCYRRFIQMYGDVVMGVQKLPSEDHDPFEEAIENFKAEIFPKEKGEVDDSKISATQMKELVHRFKTLVKKRSGNDFPTCPWEQLEGSVGAVFSSWMNDRAIVYRRKYGIPAEWGTAVNVQAMVFGNTGKKSGSGVAFTRDLPPERKYFMVNFLPMLRVKMSLLEYVPLARLLNLRRFCQSRLRNSLRSKKSWNSTLRTCRTLSLLLKKKTLHVANSQW